MKRAQSSYSRVFLVIALLMLALACGKKGAPKPPEVTAPSPVKYLSAAGSVTGIRLDWEAPNSDASGNDLQNLAGFVVRRRDNIANRKTRFVTVAEISHSVGDASTPPETKYSYQDTKVEPGKSYDYLVVPVNTSSVAGESDGVLRVTFVGESSTVERL